MDLGCGDGSLLNALNNRGIFTGKAVYAVDLSQSRLDKVQRINPEFSCLQRDVCKTELPDGSIDFLMSTQVIEHVESDADMVKEIRRLLSPKGTVYINTVFKKWYGWYFYRCNGKWTLDPTHLREYTDDGQLLDTLREQGFDILASEKFKDGRPVLDALLRRLGYPAHAYNYQFLRSLRRFRIPIPGYYIWEIACKRI